MTINSKSTTNTPQPVTPRAMSTAWTQEWFLDALKDIKAYSIDTENVRIKLDQNESPWDWRPEFKQRVATRLTDIAWNRYPAAFVDTLTEAIARYIGLPSDCVMTGPGSNFLISLLLTNLSKCLDTPVIVAAPSFPLYESHCRGEGIAYQTWPLNDDLEYDLQLLPKITGRSLLIFASPNNPVGNTLPRATLRKLLEQNPQLLVIADEAYVEFSDEPYTPLLAEFGNLILVRTFSKTLSAAGVRLGYVVAAAPFISELKKFRLPYLLNQFTIVAAMEILENKELQDFFAMTVRETIQERDQVYAQIAKLQTQLGCSVKPSQANFLLLRWPNNELARQAYQHLIAHEILVRNVSGAPGMSGCLRMTIGSKTENAALVAALQKFHPTKN